MTVDNWINLGVAILVGGGTLTLAVMTWRSIRQTRKIHEKERRDRLLNEIIEWAMEATRSKLEGVFKDLAKDYKYSDKKFIKAQIHEIGITYSNLMVKTAYICDVAKSFDLDMEENAQNTFVQIVMLAKILGELAEAWGQKAKAEIDEYFEVLQEYEGELKNSASKVIEKASKLKVKGI